MITLGVPQYSGKTNIPKANAATDANFTEITSGTVEVTGGIGAGAGTGVTATEYGSGFHQTSLALVDVDFALTDNAGVAAYSGLKVYYFPEGAVLLHGAVADLAITKSSAGVTDTWNGDIGVGTVTAIGNAVLATTEQNIIPTTATPQAVAGVTTGDGLSTTTETGVIFDGTSTATDVYINLLVDDADQDVTTTPCNLILNGTLTLTWVNLGDK